HAEGFELSSRTVANYGFTARVRVAEGARDPQSLLVFRSEADCRLPDAVASLSSHRIGDHVLCLARRPYAHRRGRFAESLGPPSPGASGVRQDAGSYGTGNAGGARASYLELEHAES